MSKSGAFELLFKEINAQLSAHKIIVKTGIIVDASVIETPLRPKGKATHQVTTDREDEQGVSVDKTYPSSVDQEASWLKKRGKFHYGYKKHHLTDEEGLVPGVVTTKASVNEIGNLSDLSGTVDLPEGIALKVDKGHPSEKNGQLLKSKKLKNHILKKAKKNKPLTRTCH